MKLSSTRLPLQVAQFTHKIPQQHSKTAQYVHNSSYQIRQFNQLKQSFGLVNILNNQSTYQRKNFQAQAASAPPQEEKFTYQAEVSQLLNLIVNSLYSNREVFLRELISNASDALDKARFLAVTEPQVLSDTSDQEIRIRVDQDRKIVIIEDTGIGMVKEELISSLGTIARSGTAKFLEMVKKSQQQQDSNLIGQFGVGFYSSFLVADKVQVVTKSPYEGQQWVWESNNQSSEFSIKEDTSGDRLARGTRVILHLKEDCEEFAETRKIEELIKQYSEYITFPIKLWSAKREPFEVPDAEATKKRQEEENKKAKEESREPTEVKPQMKTDFKESFDYNLMNQAQPIWVRNPKEVTTEEYNTFYKQAFKEFLEPIAYQHFQAEGTIEFSSVLFMPGMAPFEASDMTSKGKNIKLYVKKVFISDEFSEDLLPRYLRFIKGVVDSSDLPLNVSREILQENRVVRVIKKQLVRKAFDMLDEIKARENKEDFYTTFWEAFGKYLKVGIIEDSANRSRIADLLLFYSSNSSNDRIDFKTYVANMKEGQKQIFYLAVNQKEQAGNTPFMEKFLKKGYEVLYLTDPVDEISLTNLAKYNEYEFADVSKQDVDISDDEEKEEFKKQEEKYKDLIQFLDAHLKGKTEQVSVSQRLTDSPCALVTSKFGWSANMEKIMKSQTFADTRAMEYMAGRKILEINPKHPIIMQLEELVKTDPQNMKAKNIADLLFETALLTSGFTLESPNQYGDRVYKMLGQALSSN